MKAEGEARLAVDMRRDRSSAPAGTGITDGPMSVRLRFLDAIGVPGTDKDGRPLPSTIGDEAGTRAVDGGMDAKGPKSLATGGGILPAVIAEPAGDGVGVGTDAEAGAEPSAGGLVPD